MVNGIAQVWHATGAGHGFLARHVSSLPLHGCFPFSKCSEVAMSSSADDVSHIEAGHPAGAAARLGKPMRAQGTGLVLVVSESKGFPVVMASENARSFLDRSVEEILGGHLEGILDIEDMAKYLAACPRNQEGEGYAPGAFPWRLPLPVVARSRDGEIPLSGTLHRCGDCLVFELFREVGDGGLAGKPLEPSELVEYAAEMMLGADTAMATEKALGLLRAAVGADAAYVFRFQEGGSIRVLAENAVATMPSFVGHEWALAASNERTGDGTREWCRYVGDLLAAGAEVRGAFEAGASRGDPLLVVLREPSAGHASLLSRMGARGAITALLGGVDGPWGAVACHFRQPCRHVADNLLRCGHLANVLSLRFGVNHLSRGDGVFCPRMGDEERSWRNEESEIRGKIPDAVDGILSINARGEILSCNPAAEKIFGRVEAELLGQDVCILLSSTRREKSTDLFQRNAQTGEPRIIGEGTREQEALGMSEERLRLLLEGSDDAFWEWDVTTDEVYFSPRWREMMGFTARINPISPPSTRDLIHPEDRPLVDAVIEDHLTGRTLYYEVEHRIRHVDGHWLWVRDRGRVTARDEEGRPLRVSGIHTDITARKEAERAIGNSEMRFRTLIESAECVILIARPNGSLLYASPFAEVLTGYSAEEITDQDSLSVFVPVDALRLATRQGTEDPARFRPRSIEMPLVCKDGRVRWLAWNLRYLQEYHGEAAVLCVGHDITDLKRAQESLLRAERLSAIGEVYTGLAHESRNVLQRSQACIELLAHRVKDRPDALGLIDRLQKAQDHLHLLYEEVRGYAVPLKLELTDFDLAQLLADTWEELGVARGDREASLKIVAVSPFLFSRVDPFRLGQVFRNIFENSLAAAPDPVFVEATLRRLDVEGAPTIEVRVADNGPGFSPESMARVFDPFFTTKTKGTGLGMAISKRIVEAHGGRITARNRQAGGAEICLVLRQAPG